MIRALIIAAIVTVVAPAEGFRPAKRLCFVVDVSGSMSGWEMGKALEAFSTFAGQPVDDGKLCVIAFDSEVRKLDWHSLPDAKHVRDAETWLDLEQANGETLVIPALEAALAECPDKALTVVLVSDGRFFKESKEQIQAAIKAAQAKRKIPASIGVVGVHEKGEDKQALKAVVNGAGYYLFPQDER